MFNITDGIWLDIRYDLEAQNYYQDSTNEPPTFLQLGPENLQKNLALWMAKFGAEEICMFNAGESNFKDWFICATKGKKSNWEWD